MPCYHPMRRWWFGELTGDGKQTGAVITDLECKLLTSRKKGGQIYHGYWPAERWSEEIPCGKCYGCRMEYAKQWATRCILESKQWENNWFITLTYDDEHLPLKEQINTDTGEMKGIMSATLEPPAVTKFMKDLRRYWKYHYDEDNIRFYACGEYGGRNGRPHYHIIAFNLNIRDIKPLGRTQTGRMQWDSDIIRKIWGKGLTGLGKVEYESCAYVARYMLKKQKGPGSTEWYAEKGLVPEFTRTSRRPGVGGNYYEANKDKIYSYDEIILPKGQKVKPPKYYDKLYDIEYPYEMEEIKKARKKAAKESEAAELAKTTLTKKELLEVKERTAKERIKKLKRGIEE